MEFDYENFYSSLEKVLRSWKKAEKAVKAWGQNGYKHNINTKTQCAGLIKKNIKTPAEFFTTSLIICSFNHYKKNCKDEILP